MSDFSLIVVIVGGVLLGLGYTFAYRRGKDPATEEMDYEKKLLRQLEEQDKRARRMEELQDRADERAERLDQLLTKWEEQARRQDAILEHLERLHDIKKD